MRFRAMPRLGVSVGMLVLGGCGSGSEPLRRIDALEARVERLEQASRSAAPVEPGPAADSTPEGVRPSR